MPFPSNKRSTSSASSFDEKSRYDPNAMSQFENPGGSDEQGFVDDDPNLPMNEESLMTLRQRRAVNKSSVFLVVGIVLIVVVAVAFTRIAGVRFRGDKRQNEPTSNVGPSVPPTPPSDIDITCALVNLQQSDAGYNACLEVCQPAQCCEIVPENPFSCIESHRKECETYRASCQHLQHKKAQDIINGDLSVDVVCSTQSLTSEDGVKACEKMCDGYRCCFQDPDTCDISQAWCKEYGACHALDLLEDSDGFDSHDEAQGAIEVACSDMRTYHGQSRCSYVCQPAQCCFLDSSNPGEEAPIFDEKACPHNCTHYDACSVLYGTNHGSQQQQQSNQTDTKGPDPITNMLAQKCSNESISTLAGFQNCYGECYYHMCCFQDDPVKTCEEGFVDSCPAYLPCAVLADSPVVDASKGFVDSSCTPEKVETMAGLSQCREVCAEHLCCLQDPSNPSSCVDELGATECAKYSSCSILITDTHEVYNSVDADEVTEVKAACTAANIRDDRQKCEDACSKRSCCYETGTCYDTDTDWCDKVSECKLLDAAAVNTTIDTTTSQLQTLCSETSISTKSGFVDCYNQCSDHLCCFTDSCDDDSQCLSYAPCEVLVDSTVREASKEAVDTVCTTELIETETGLAECHKVCARHLCCLPESSCADVFDAGVCDNYASCAVLTSNNPPTNTNGATTDLATTCSQNAIKTLAGIRDCHEECQDFLCCFSGSCPDDSMCPTYAPCEILVDSQVVEASKGAVDNVCTAELVATEGGLAECHELCARHLCCLNDSGTPSSCVDDFGAGVCDDYASCEILSSEHTSTDTGGTTGGMTNKGTGGTADGTVDLETMCSQNAISALAGFRECHEECQDYLCCFSNSCPDDSMCPDYAPCQILVNSPIADANKLAVDNVCTAELVATASGLAECHEVCAKHLCCLNDSGSPSSCVGDLGAVVCDDYASCEILSQGGNTPSATGQDLAAICSQNAISTLAGFRECHLQCQDHLCCHSGTCPESVSCTDYTACDTLAATNIVDAGKDAVDGACTEEKVGTTTGLATCHEICAEHLCCLLGSSSPSYCVDRLGATECDKYAACEILSPQGTQSAISDGITETTSAEPVACNELNLQTVVGQMECNNECAVVECCFKHLEEGGCYDDKKDWCDQYPLCENVFGSFKPSQ